MWPSQRLLKRANVRICCECAGVKACQKNAYIFLTEITHGMRVLQADFRHQARRASGSEPKPRVRAGTHKQNSDHERLTRPTFHLPRVIFVRSIIVNSSGHER